MSRPYRYMCDNCHRSKSNQSSSTYCEHCRQDSKDISALCDAIREGTGLWDQCDVELIARVWRYVARERYPNAAPKAEQLLIQHKTVYQRVLPLSAPPGVTWDPSIGQDSEPY